MGALGTKLGEDITLQEGQKTYELYVDRLEVTGSQDSEENHPYYYYLVVEYKDNDDQTESQANGKALQAKVRVA